jgi:hypothetical protein
LAIGETHTALAAAIETFLIAFSVCRLIVRGTALAGTLQVMMVAAAEWTTQVSPTCVPGMSEKPNPAVQTGNSATLKLGMGLQNRVQRGLILQDKRLGAIVLMPIRANREKLLDAYGKKAKLSVIILMLFTPSSYHLGAKATRGRARFFMRDGRGSTPTVRTNHPPRIAPPIHPACRINAAFLRARS